MKTLREEDRETLREEHREEHRVNAWTSDSGIDDGGKHFDDQGKAVMNSPVLGRRKATICKVRSEMFVRFFG